MTTQEKADRRRLALMRRAEAWLQRQYGDSAPESEYTYNDVVTSMMRFADRELRRKVQR